MAEFSFRSATGAGLLALTLAACATMGTTPAARTSPPAPRTTPTPLTSTSPGRTAPHVMVLVMENRDYSEVIGNVSAPYVNQLASGFGLATNVYAQTHPSLPNYLALISGNTSGITSDCTDCSASGPTVMDQLENAGYSWRAYMESMPGPCYAGVGTNGGYARKHDPFLYFPQIAATPSRCANVVPMSQMNTDLNGANPPDFVFAVPNLCHDGHDCATRVADSWLASTMPTILASRWYAQGGIVILTWDEGSSGGCCSGADGGHIATIVVGGSVRRSSRLTATADHAGILRTVENIFGLPPLGLASCSCSGSLNALLRSG